MSKKMGRRKLKFDVAIFEMLCSLQCTQAEIANHLKMSPDTLDRRIREEYGEDKTFAAIFSTKRLGGILSLRRKLFSTAMAGDKTLLIWLDKKYAHLQGDVDQRIYGGESGGTNGDNKIDISVSFKGQPDKCVVEAQEIEKLKDED